MEKTESKIKTCEAAMAIRDTWRGQHHQVVFTNGCFDLLHLGHVDYLEKARQLGDRLIVGVNTDASVRRYKGAERPLQDQQARTRIMAALAFVDMVVLFDEDTPFRLISALLPDILVKGNDYLAENIVGSDVVEENGGKVLTLDFVEGYSTTGIVNKIKTINT